ncbi:DUF4157 domain-containing protein [Fulvivirgaceae bacterium PWU4]|uniref:DUF4157 domain-containing protein n=1 Tax=Chryseosolibacter histidini TaxID=2782349 RepID=A0AAP2DNX9_9BACT|nr:DUF4157 domain-containing protein [Chryseosolibacter histidini]MBT1698668.1 DUF4157 domain-containing protein [Chryseosolibacter histidini]
MKVFDRLSRLITWPKAKDKHLPDGETVHDNRPESVTQRKEKELIAGSPRTVAQQQRFAESLAQPNNTGLPDTLKAGLENLSGLDLSPVRVHYNSSQPEQYKALAYAQGTDIHLAPGQQKHLPHEGWHVVQQLQQKVKPTHQLGNGQYVNDQTRLEREADEMGAKAAKGRASALQNASQANQKPVEASDSNVAQMKFKVSVVAPQSNDVRELSDDEITTIKSKLANNAAALAVFEIELATKSFIIIPNEGSDDANIARVIKFCVEEAAQKSGSGDSKWDESQSWKGALDRKKKKGVDSMGIQPTLVDEPRKRGHRGGRRHATAEKRMTEAVGEAETEEKKSHMGHLISHKLGGVDAAVNKAVTTEFQEKWQKVVESSVASALREGTLRPEQVRLKVTAYNLPGSKDVARALRIKVLLLDGAEGFVKMIDVTTTHECTIEPDASNRRAVQKVLEDWGQGKGNVYNWLRIHNGFPVEDEAN